tara:strand:- start:6375 stop:7205 length:831 start_codon:yes stop_codon:yes gene_type:complete
MQHCKKRFTDTKKWEKEWFLSLSLEDKLVWLYLLDSCDECGLWNVNWRLCSILTGVEVTSAPDSIKRQLVETNHDKVIYIQDFMDFQYGLQYLEKKSPMITKCVKKLISYGVIEQSDFDTAQLLDEGDATVAATVQVKEKVEDKDKVKVVKKDTKSLKSIDDSYLDELQLLNMSVDVKVEFQKFTDYLQANGKRYKDYRAAFRNWLKSEFTPKTDEVRKRMNREKEEREKRQRDREIEEARANGEYEVPEEFTNFVKKFKSRSRITNEETIDEKAS